MTETTPQRPLPEHTYAEELSFLAHYDLGPRPPGWQLTPAAVVTFIMGSTEPLKLSGKAPKSLPKSLQIEEKFVGDRALVERAVVTLAGQRGLLLVGEPGTAKSMISELLAAAISNTSALTIQGTAGTSENQLRYDWNYALLIARGPHPEALVPSPVLTAMRSGSIVRVEEITRCLPEVQDALVSILSDRRLAIPELGQDSATVEHAQPGFNLIATANLRDRGVNEMSAALKRRLNFEHVPPIHDLKREVALVQHNAQRALSQINQTWALDEATLEALVTTFRDLRLGTSVEGWPVERPTTVMSTAEAVAVASSIAIQQAYLPTERDPASLIPGYLLGTVLKDDPQDRARLLAYWDSTIKRRADTSDARLWRHLLSLRHLLEQDLL
jgi:MoxR-like ATPase